MTLTAPGSISNSGPKPFSNLFVRIAMDNYNIVQDSLNSYYFEDHSKKNHKKKSHKKYSNLKPKSINEIIMSTGLMD